MRGRTLGALVVVGMLAVPLASPAMGAVNTPTFGTATLVGLNGETDPSAIATADLNADGKLDLITANRGLATVSVALGTGGGAYGTASTFSTGGSFPTAVAVGYIDSGSNLDVVTANGGSDNVSVLLGNGSGGLGSATTVGTGSDSFPAGVAIADLENDGDRDLVVTSASLNRVVVLKNTGSGSFGGPAFRSVGSVPQSIAVGDIDGDNDPDAVVGNVLSNNVSVLVNDGTGTFPAPTNIAVGALPLSVALEDLDGDGDRDIVTANVSGSVSVLEGTGSGGFGAAANTTVAAPTSVAIGDVNGDTEPDVVVTSTSPNAAITLLGDGDAGFAGSASFGLGGGTDPSQGVVADLSGDGRADIATANTSSNDVSVLLNTLAPSCDGQTATIVGTSGDDVLIASAGGSVIYGGGGEDVIIGNIGTDVICAGAGDDTTVNLYGSDRVFGQAGDDLVVGGLSNDSIWGGWGDDLLYGSFGNDALVGGAGTDTCDGGPDTDTAASCETVTNVP